MLDKVNSAEKQSIVQFDEWNRIISLLREDTMVALDFYKADFLSQYHRRTLVRTCWAMYEGFTYGLKQWLLCLCNLGEVDLTADHRIFLSETSFSVNEHGHTNKRDHFNKSTENMKQTFKLVRSFICPEWSMNFCDNNWKCLCESLEIRHRITHPKNASLLDISDQEIKVLESGLEWYLYAVNDFSEQLLLRIK